MTHLSRITLAMFAAALSSYMAEWTSAGSGLGFLGALVELVGWSSASADSAQSGD